MLEDTILSICLSCETKNWGVNTAGGRKEGGMGARTDSLQDDADTEIPYAVAHARMVTRDVRLRGGE